MLRIKLWIAKLTEFEFQKLRLMWFSMSMTNTNINILHDCHSAYRNNR